MTDPAPLVLQERFIVTPATLLYDDRLTGDDIRVYGVLYDHGYAKGSCFPGRTRLAQLCRLSQRTLDGCVERLESCGYIETKRRWKDHAGRIYYEGGSGRTQTSTEYVLRTATPRADSAGPSAPRGTAGIDTRTSTSSSSSSKSSSSGADSAVPRGPQTARPPSTEWSTKDPYNFAGAEL